MHSFLLTSSAQGYNLAGCFSCGTTTSRHAILLIQTSSAVSNFHCSKSLQDVVTYTHSQASLVQTIQS